MTTLRARSIGAKNSILVSHKTAMTVAASTSGRETMIINTLMATEVGTMMALTMVTITKPWQWTKRTQDSSNSWTNSKCKSIVLTTSTSASTES